MAPVRFSNEAGRNNPTVKLWVIDLTRMDYAKTEIVPPEDYKGKTTKCFLVPFSSNGFSFSPKNLPRESHGRGWIDIQDKPIFGEDKRFYFIRLPLADGKAGYFRHVAMINTSKTDISSYQQKEQAHHSSVGGKSVFVI
ncbi:venom dipeptidyl peptidase 4 [Trichonephila clavipes]|nr:venom dipeptidyl peptidase 4 [Trichonephila clavipes]